MKKQAVRFQLQKSNYRDEGREIFMNTNLLKSNHFTSIKSGLISIGLMAVFCLACTNFELGKNVGNSELNASPKTEKPSVVDIPKLMNQSPKVFEDTFGLPIKKCSRKGEKTNVCDYKIVGLGKPAQTDAGLTVFFENDRAVRINADLIKQTGNVEEALSQVNIDIINVPPQSKNKSGDTWENQTFSGIKFKQLSAAKLDLNNENYTTIQAFVE